MDVDTGNCKTAEEAGSWKKGFLTCWLSLLPRSLPSSRDMTLPELFIAVVLH